MTTEISFRFIVPEDDPATNPILQVCKGNEPWMNVAYVMVPTFEYDQVRQDLIKIARKQSAEWEAARDRFRLEKPSYPPTTITI